MARQAPTARITSLVRGSVPPATRLAPRNSALAPGVGTVTSIVSCVTDVAGNGVTVDTGGAIFRLEPPPLVEGFSAGSL